MHVADNRRPSRLLRLRARSEATARATERWDEYELPTDIREPTRIRNRLIILAVLGPAAFLVSAGGCYAAYSHAVGDSTRACGEASVTITARLSQCRARLASTRSYPHREAAQRSVRKRHGGPTLLQRLLRARECCPSWKANHHHAAGAANADRTASEIKSAESRSAV